MKNLKIGTRMIIGFLIIAIIAGAIGVVGIISLNDLNTNYSINYTASLNALESLAGISSCFQRLRLNTAMLIQSNASSDKEYYIDRIASWEAEVRQNIAAYSEMLDGYDESEIVTPRGLLADIENSFSRYQTLADDFISEYGMDVSRQSEAVALLGTNSELRKIALEVDDAVNALLTFNLQYGNNINTQNGDRATLAIRMMCIIIAVGVILAIFIGLSTARGISRPVQLLVKAADKLALGDVNVDIEIHTKDEIGKLAHAFHSVVTSIKGQVLAAQQVAAGDLTTEVEIRSENDVLGRELSTLVKNLNQMVHSIVSAAEQVASGSNMLSDSSMALSQGATEQASSVEELTASLEEISSQTSLNAENAEKANNLARHAKTNADSGNAQMQEMLKAMDEINVSSRDINKIIKVIDDIAFQTNILALNAAVEAARAGQHGKGFAVVAEEVRTLAARSANAAKETTDMIEGSIRKVEAGTKIANETAKALAQIVDEVEKAAVLVDSIAVASKEQSLGIEQINQGIMQVSQVVQTNAATSEEGAAASEELSGQAAQLKEIVSVFRLKKAGGVLNDSGPEPEAPQKSEEDIKENPNEGDMQEPVCAAAPASARIALSDSEFGKY